MAITFDTEGSERINNENLKFWKDAFEKVGTLGKLWLFDRPIGEPAKEIEEGAQSFTPAQEELQRIDETTPRIGRDMYLIPGVKSPYTIAPGAAVAAISGGMLGGGGSGPANMGKRIVKEGAEEFVGPVTPKYAGSVNLERQLISEEAKRVEARLFEEHGIKTKVTQEEMREKANTVLQRFRDEPDYFKERVTAYQSGEKPSIEEELAHRIINASNFQNFVDVAKQVEKGSIPKEVMEEMLNSIEGHYLSVTQPMATEAGRRLNMYNIEVGRSRAMDAIAKLDEHLNERQLKDLTNVKWDDPKSVTDFIKRLPNPTAKEYFYEYWYNSILSGIPTHIVNVASNTLWRSWQVPHRAGVAMIDKLISAATGREREVFMDEVLPMISGEVTGFGKAARNAWDVFRHNRLVDVEDKWAKEMDFAMGAFERSPSATVRAIGIPLTGPTRALRAMDVFANSIAYDSQMQALARRAFHKAGNKGDLDTFTKEFVSNPPKWAQDESLKFSKYTTFTDDPGAISRWVAEGRDIIPGGRLIVPFVNTIGNIMKRGVEMTPGIGLALSKGQPTSEVAAKQIEGAIIALAMMKKIQAGEVTGAPPENKEEREAFYRQKKEPWAIKVGDTYYQYRRVEPFNMPLSLMVEAYDKIKNAKDEKTATDVFFDVATNMKDHIIDSGYLQGVANFFDSQKGQIKTMPQRMASSLVPFSGFWRSVNRAYEASEEGQAKVYDHRDWLSSFAQVIPGLYKLREPKLNVWGEEISLQGNAFRQWLPYKWSQETNDPVETFLERLSNKLENEGERGVYPGIPDQWIRHKGTKIRMDDDAYRQYAIDYGVNAKKQLLEKITGETNWAEKLETNPKSLKNRIENVLDKERERALRRAKKNMGLIGNIDWEKE